MNTSSFLRATSMALMRPGMRLMAHLRLPAKMSLLCAVLLPPMVLLLVSAAWSAQASLQTVRAEQAGAASMRHVSELALLVAMHRTLSNQVAAGESRLAVKRDTVRLRLRQAVNRFDATMQRPQPFAMDDVWRPERERLLALADGLYADNRAEARAEHAARVETLRRMALLIGERSQLLFDPEAATFFLMDIGVERVIPWLEALGRLDALGEELLARDASPIERTHMLSYAEAARHAADDVSLRLQALGRTGEPVPGTAVAAREASERFAAFAHHSFDTEGVSAEASAFNAFSNDALDAVWRFDEEVWQQFDALLEQRARGVWRQLIWQGLALACGLVAAVYLAFSFFFGFSGALQAVIRSVQAVEEGDLSQPVQVPGNDELAEVGRRIEGMSARLSTLVGEIRSSAVRVDQAGVTVADEGRALSQRTEEQAASLSQTLATVRQLSLAVTSNAEASGALQVLTEDLRHNAAAGHGVMAGTVESMRTLEERVRTVADINAVIDDIAFQTNLLALNASVEAARAGEAGRGFSVVATAVRQLAARTGEAAAEVRTLIESATDQTGRSVHCIEEAGSYLDSIVTGVGEVSRRLSGIAGASAEQSRALDEVTAGVSSLEDITQHNATMVARSTSAALMLNGQATTLRESVASIQLRSGSADEASSLVERAMGYIATEGWDRAVAAFHDPLGPFTGRDLHLFALDREGRYLVCSARPEFVGRSIFEVSTLSSADADALLQAGQTAAAQGRGWMDYLGTDWRSEALIHKSAYVFALDEGAFLACGIERQRGAQGVRPAVGQSTGAIASAPVSGLATAG